MKPTGNYCSACVVVHLGYFHVDIFSIFKVIALDLVKINIIQLVLHVTQKVFDL
jgi:hypothetical protein